MKNYTSSQYVQGKQITYSDNESKQLIKDAKQVTHEQLKQIRDKSTLIPGQWYRITDYVCTTTQENTQSAGHPFDILVRADTADKLNETAYATLHKGDTYFANSKLEAWELKYTIDNDTTRFAWADSENGKGVIYYMKDEFGNECPYDFKNIMFKRTITLGSGYPELDLEGGEDTWCYTFTATKYDITNDEWSGIIDGSLESPYEHMSDEGTSTYHHNIIKEYIQLYNNDEDRSKAGLMYLNNNVFLGYFEYNGGEDDYQYARCAHSNNFGNNCYDITFGNGCKNNTFGNECYQNTFGNTCCGNTFGNECYKNTFGNSCSRNTFGDECYVNTFGNDCEKNTFGNECYQNTFGNTCCGNTFGDSCFKHTFGNGCQSNTFGNRCNYNTFGSSAQSPQSYFENIIFENGNMNINLTCNQTTSISNKCRNVLVALDVNNTNTAKTITIDAVNQNFKTVVCTDSLGQIVTYIPGDAHHAQAVAD